MVEGKRLRNFLLNCWRPMRLGSRSNRTELESTQRLANGDFTFELFADTVTFNIERSTDLQTWAEPGAITVTAPNFPGTTFSDNNAHGLSNAFYRVKKRRRIL